MSADPEIDLESLRRFIVTRMTGFDHACGARHLSVGVEQEFFVYSSITPPRPATFDESQRLLANLGGMPEFVVDPCLGEYIAAVVISGPVGAVVVKYEQAPHLMELSTPPAATIGELRLSLRTVWEALDGAALATGLAVVHEAHSRVSPAHRSLSPLTTRSIALREYRFREALVRGFPLSEGRANFSAAIAATQIHIGRVAWHNEPGIVEDLYLDEPYFLPLEYRAFGKARGRWLAQSRWRRYARGCFGPLVGYPDLHSWDLDAWIKGMAKSPHLAAPPPVVPSDFLLSVRDNQSIKPRPEYGTIEFRGAPTQPSIQAVVSLAAARLGQVARLVDGVRDHEPASFLSRRDQWWGKVLGETSWTEPNTLVQSIRGGLARRGQGEEAFLA